MPNTQFCEYLTGSPEPFYSFLAHFETNNTLVEFYVSAPVEVDWGEGIFLRYEKGTIHGKQTHSNANVPVQIRSLEKVETVRFGPSEAYDNGFLEIHIDKALDMTSAYKMCYRLESMKKFTFFGTNKIVSFESAWEHCTNLLVFEGIDTTNAIDMTRAWKNCKQLKVFPAIYSRLVTTLEEAWMGCTSMEEFPLIGVESCKNFNSAWRGNVKLSIFPYIDISAGETFDFAWSYCINLVNFPALDFKNARSMDHMMSYMQKLENLQNFETPLSTNFDSIFKNSCLLSCVQGIDTTATGAITKDMFVDTPMLQRPTASEQTDIMLGSKWLNDEACYYDAGRSLFFALAQTTSTCEVSFTVWGGDVEVDWGNGLYLPYPAGTVSGMSVDSHVIKIKSEEEITRIKFISDEFLSVGLKRIGTLVTLRETCSELKKLKSFHILGNTQKISAYRMLYACSGLEEVTNIEWSNITSANGMMHRCTSLVQFQTDDLIMSSCKDFSRMFQGCKKLQSLPVIMTTNNIAKTFKYMMANCTSLVCLGGIDTTNNISTTGMFQNTPAMLRPNTDEKIAIVGGSLYEGDGSCDGIFSMVFDAATEVKFTVDASVTVIWGDGSEVNYPAGSQVVGTPNGESFVFGDVRSITFDTYNFSKVHFLSIQEIPDMTSLLQDQVLLTHFELDGKTSLNTQADSMFSGCTALAFFEWREMERVISANSFFANCTSIVNYGILRTSSCVDFENMFLNNTSGVCIDELDTRKGIFGDSLLDCTAGAPADSCLDYYTCFGGSTMFDGSNFTSPDTEDRDALMNRALYVNETPCV